MKIKFLLIALFISQIGFTQNNEIEIKYYKNSKLDKEVVIEKATFSKTIYSNIDSSKTIEIKDLVKNIVIERTSYKNEEQTGIWIIEINGKQTKLDYNFELKDCYSSDYCDNNELKFKKINYLENNDSLNYKAPILKNESLSIQNVISSNIYYPERALENEIQGLIVVNFNVNEEGKVENVKIIKKCNTLLDKEAVRVIRNLEFISPPILNGIKMKICLNIPIIFKIS